MKKSAERFVIVLLILALALLSSCQKASVSSKEYLVNAAQSVYDDGMFYLSFFENSLHFVDFNTLIDIPVCAKPNCTHKDNSCSSKGFSRTPIIYHGESLYWFVNEIVFADSDREAINKCTIYKCDRDGTNRMKLGELPRDIAISNVRMVLSGDIVYFIGGNECSTADRLDDKSKWSLYSYNLATKELSEVIDIGEQYHASAAIDGMYNGRLYMVYQGFDENVSTSELTFEDYSKVRKFIYYDFEDKTIHDAEYERLCIADGYFVSIAPNGVRITSTDGISSIAEKFEPIELNMYSVVNDKLICMSSGSAYDPKTEKYYTFKAGFQPIAYRDGKYIVSTRREDGTQVFSEIAEKDFMVEEQ